MVITTNNNDLQSRKINTRIISEGEIERIKDFVSSVLMDNKFKYVIVERVLLIVGYIFRFITINDDNFDVIFNNFQSRFNECGFDIKMSTIPDEVQIYQIISSLLNIFHLLK